MNKTPFRLFQLVLIFSGIQALTLSVKGQDNAGNADRVRPSHNHIISLYPIALAGNTLQMGYEAGLGKALALRAIPSLTTSGRREIMGNSQGQFGLSGELQTRYYIHSTSIHHFSVFGAVYGEFKYRTWNDPVYATKRDLSARAASGGLLMGLQTGIGRHFVVDLYLGGGYQRTFDDAPVLRSNSLNSWQKGISPRFGLNAGVKF